MDRSARIPIPIGAVIADLMFQHGSKFGGDLRRGRIRVRAPTSSVTHRPTAAAALLATACRSAIWH